MHVARFGAWLAVAISGALAVWVSSREVGLNVANGWTIISAATAGVVVLLWAKRWACVLAAFLILLALVPAVFGGIGFLYVPSLAMFIVGASRSTAPAARGTSPAGRPDLNPGRPG